MDDNLEESCRLCTGNIEVGGVDIFGDGLVGALQQIYNIKVSLIFTWQEYTGNLSDLIFSYATVRACPKRLVMTVRR